MKLKYNIYSPDNLFISLEWFDSSEEALKFFEKWKLQFYKKPYRDNSWNLIYFEDLDDYCRLHSANFDDDDDDDDDDDLGAF